MTRGLIETTENAIGSLPSRRSAAVPQAAYGRVFWLAYLANATTMIAISILVRYADFVTFLGGSEVQLGLIVGTGMVGSLFMRLAQGVGIDLYGPRRIWIASLVLLMLTMLGHLWVTSAFGPAIFLLRIVMSTSVAGIFGASITYISRRVPPVRMAEMIGTLGTSGFIGILVGPQIGDWICGTGPIGRDQLDRLFLVAAGMICASIAAAWAATCGATVQVARRRPPALGLLRRYHPGTVVFVAVAVGVGVTMPPTFLRTFAAELNIPKIGLFFAVYAMAAFAFRITTRRLPERIGTRPLIVIGLAILATSMLLYLPVRETWQLVMPGVVAGAAHAFLFPSVVASGSTAFPERHRGLGTTLMLSMFDVGNLVGAPAIGGILGLAKLTGLPAYPTMFISLAVGLVAISVVFVATTAGGQRRRR